MFYLKFFSKLHGTGSGIKYFNIGKNTVGFYHTDYEINNDYVCYQAQLVSKIFL